MVKRRAPPFDGELGDELDRRLSRVLFGTRIVVGLANAAQQARCRGALEARGSYVGATGSARELVRLLNNSPALLVVGHELLSELVRTRLRAGRPCAGVIVSPDAEVRAPGGKSVVLPVRSLDDVASFLQCVALALECAATLDGFDSQRGGAPRLERVVEGRRVELRRDWSACVDHLVATRGLELDAASSRVLTHLDRAQTTEQLAKLACVSKSTVKRKVKALRDASGCPQGVDLAWHIRRLAGAELQPTLPSLPLAPLAVVPDEDDPA